jgi:hypothetical protein
MPLPGGAADKIGNRYEGRWTVLCMVDVMDEKADAIRLEPPGLEGEGFEFWLSKGNCCEYHQVKRQRADGSWTIANLKSKAVVSNFWEKLKMSTAWCIFVSTDRAFELGELADRARSAASWQEFDQEFLKAEQTKASKQLQNFQRLCRYWNNCTEIDAYEALKRIAVRTIDEDTLRTTVESRIAALVEGNPANAVDVLAQFALDKVHHKLTAHDIWCHLESRGYRRREWGKDAHVLAAVDKVNERYISLLQKEAIAGQVIPRDEVKIVLDKLLSPIGKRSVLIAGTAGLGKSTVILQVVEEIRKKAIPVIAFRVDRLNPKQSPDNVIEELPGSPAIVLAAIAQGRDCVLVIDQLDAVSLTSGRNSWFFECVEQIIDQAKAYPQMCILMACRKFDLDNDYRLKRLTGEHGIAETVTISRLSHTTVQKVVTKLGLDARRLNEKQLDLLSIPLHLSLLARVALDTSVDVLNFKTAKDLYDKFWQHKKNFVEERLGRDSNWTEVIYTLCDYMSKHQRLSAPKARVDKYEKSAEIMASEHVLIPDREQYLFFHEGFFDYAFARRFVGKDDKLLNLLQSGEQHLFRRAQVRQILLYERDADRDRYLADLNILLNSSDIRFHLKKVVIALLATLDDPKEEWEIISHLMCDEINPLTQEVWIILNSSIHWFKLLDSLGIIKRWLRDKNEKRVDKTVTLLSFMQKQVPDRVAELLEPFVGVSENWSKRFVNLIGFAEFGTGRRFFDLFLRLIDMGVLDDQVNDGSTRRDFWSHIYDLPKQNPEWACEATGHFLNRRLNISLAAGHPNPFDNDSSTIPYSVYYKEVLNESPINAPLAFIEYILPFMLRVIDLTAIKQGNPPWQDAVWRFRIYGDDYKIDNVLLNKMEAALSSVAVNHPEDFAKISEQYLRHSNFETIQYLLVRAYAANGEIFADVAIDYLCEQPVRLETGGDLCRNTIIGDEPYWATYQLLKVTTTFCSQEQIIKLQAVILDYYTDVEKTAIGLSYRGYPQLVLLNAIAPSRRTEAANRRLQEWERKFKDSKLLERLENVEPSDLMASIIGSPIPESAAEKMTDGQWLSAIACYNHSDPSSWFQRNGEFVGGSGELSHILEKQVKSEPERFAKLVWEFPDSTHPHYFDAVLRGIADVDIDAETALQVCQRCHQLPNRPCGRSIGWLYRKLAKLSWTTEALDMVIWYALNDFDPVAELQRSNQNHNIHSKGINSTRGSAVSAIAALIFADKNRTSYFQEALQKIVQDPSIAVRSCAAEALTAMLNYDRNLAVSLFQELCETEEDAVLGTQTVKLFLYYALPTHFQVLVPILERMIKSESPEVVKIGTQQACLVSLFIEEARWLAEVCLSDTEIHRAAAAEIFVKYLRQARFREFCENALIQLFHDSNVAIRSQAGNCFFWFKEEELGEYVSLIEAFVDSPAFTNNTRDLFHALERISAKLPEVTFRVCDRFLQNLKSNNPEVRNRIIFADEVSKLLVRLYGESKNEDLRSRCLDLVDCMARMGVYGLNEALQELER